VRHLLSRLRNHQPAAPGARQQRDYMMVHPGRNELPGRLGDIYAYATPIQDNLLPQRVMRFREKIDSIIDTKERKDVYRKEEIKKPDEFLGRREQDLARVLGHRFDDFNDLQEPVMDFVGRWGGMPPHRIPHEP